MKFSNLWKLESLAYRVALFALSLAVLVWRTHTQKHDDNIYRASIASSGKNRVAVNISDSKVNASLHLTLVLQWYFLKRTLQLGGGG